MTKDIVGGSRQGIENSSFQLSKDYPDQQSVRSTSSVSKISSAGSGSRPDPPNQQSMRGENSTVRLAPVPSESRRDMPSQQSTLVRDSFAPRVAPAGDNLRRQLLNSRLPHMESSSKAPSFAPRPSKFIAPQSSVRNQNSRAPSFDSQSAIPLVSSASRYTCDRDIFMASRHSEYDSLLPALQKENDEWAQTKIDESGSCTAGNKWQRVDGGYRCVGGRQSHYISDNIITLGEPAFYCRADTIGQQNNVSNQDLPENPEVIFAHGWHWVGRFYSTPEMIERAKVRRKGNDKFRASANLVPDPPQPGPGGPQPIPTQHELENYRRFVQSQGMGHYEGLAVSPGGGQVSNSNAGESNRTAVHTPFATPRNSYYNPGVSKINLPSGRFGAGSSRR